MNKLTPKQKSTVNRAKYAIEDSETSLSINDISLYTKITPIVVEKAIAYIPNLQQDENGRYFLNTETEDESIEREPIESKKPEGKAIEDKEIKNTTTTKPTPKRNPPFTPNPIMGYQVQQGKAKIFLDRKASSKTLTLTLDDLKELVMAVEKVGRL